MDRSKIVAIITGAIALLLGIAYLIIVQLLDFRGEMLPAPTDLSWVTEKQIQISDFSLEAGDLAGNDHRRSV
jgi:hypothetical protein